MSSSSSTSSQTIDNEKLQQFMGKILSDFGGLEDNLNPVGRMFYAGSTMVCVPASLSQNGSALGAQAGEAGISKVVKTGGFKHFRRATQTPFNIVYEARA